MNVVVTLKLVGSAFSYAMEQGREGLISNKLKESFLADFTVKFTKKEDETGDSTISAIESNAELMSSIKEVLLLFEVRRPGFQPSFVNNLFS